MLSHHHGVLIIAIGRTEMKEGASWGFGYIVPFLADYSTALEGWNNHLHMVELKVASDSDEDLCCLEFRCVSTVG